MMRSAVPLPPSCEDKALATIASGISGRERARGQRDRAVEPRHLLEAVDDAQHELRPQPERQRPQDALAVHSPPLALVGLVARHRSGSGRLRGQVDAEHEPQHRRSGGGMHEQRDGAHSLVTVPAPRKATPDGLRLREAVASPHGDRRGQVQEAREADEAHEACSRRARSAEGDRGAHGRGARRARGGAAGGARRVGGARRPPGPGRHPRGAERDARARARADPPRADDRLAVHVLPRRARRSWRGICRSTPTTGLRVQCCGDAHLSNFGVFAAPDRRSCSTSTTSTRRCRRRSSGTSSAWWRASSSPRATTATAARSSGRRRAPPPPPTGRRWPRRRRCASSTSGTRGSTPTSCSRSSRRRADKATLKAAKKVPRQGADNARAWARWRSSRERVDGGYRIKQQPPLIVRPPETMSDELRAARPPGARRLRAARSRPIGASCSTTTTTRTSRARSSASARSGPRRSWSC